MDSLHQRLIKAYELLLNNGEVHTQAQFAERIGKRATQVSDAFKDRPKRCTLGLMKAIADAFPDVLSRDYLLKGEGDVALPTRTVRPHYEAMASAGFMSGVSEGEKGTPMELIPGMADYDFTINASGDSMLPEIKTGDLLVCRRCTDRANPPIGKICVIDARDGAVVKVIAGAADGALTLHSLNPRYADYPLDFSDVLGVAEVVGMTRQF